MPSLSCGSRSAVPEYMQDPDSLQNARESRKIDHDRHTCHLSLQLSLWGTMLFAAIKNKPDNVEPSVICSWGNVWSAPQRIETSLAEMSVPSVLHADGCWASGILLPPKRSHFSSLGPLPEDFLLCKVFHCLLPFTKGYCCQYPRNWLQLAVCPTTVHGERRRTLW